MWRGFGRRCRRWWGNLPHNLNCATQSRATSALKLALNCFFRGLFYVPIFPCFSCPVFRVHYIAWIDSPTRIPSWLRGCFLNQFPLFCQMKSRDFIKSERIFRQNECQNHYLRVVMGWLCHPITTLRSWFWQKIVLRNSV